VGTIGPWTTSLCSPPAGLYLLIARGYIPSSARLTSWEHTITSPWTPKTSPNGHSHAFWIEECRSDLPEVHRPGPSWPHLQLCLLGWHFGCQQGRGRLVFPVICPTSAMSSPAYKTTASNLLPSVFWATTWTSTAYGPSPPLFEWSRSFPSPVPRVSCATFWVWWFSATISSQVVPPPSNPSTACCSLLLYKTDTPLIWMPVADSAFTRSKDALAASSWMLQTMLWELCWSSRLTRSGALSRTFRGSCTRLRGSTALLTGNC